LVWHFPSIAVFRDYMVKEVYSINVFFFLRARVLTKTARLVSFKCKNFQVGTKQKKKKIFVNKLKQNNN
jgi:hypothetical protein